MEEVSVLGRDNPQLLHVNAGENYGERKTSPVKAFPNIYLKINLSFYAIRSTILTALSSNHSGGNYRCVGAWKKHYKIHFHLKQFVPHYTIISYIQRT